MNRPRLSTYGGLKEGDLYVERPADRTLFAALLAGIYAYVLSSRQTGKTSLMVRTFNKLRQAGCRCAKVDLGFMGTDVAPDRWYQGLAVEIAEAAGRDESFVASYFAASQRRTTVQRFTRFLRDLVAQSPQPLIIFIDEIEGFLKLPMRLTDDFLAAIRSCYNDRDREPAYRRLSFCLLGVCTPAELIRDERRTPFNVARGIDLTDFAWEETRAGFLPVFGDGGAEAEEALRIIYSWSGGHPYLTHRMVEEAQQRFLQGEALTPALVEQLVRDLFLGNLGREQENFLEVERRLCLGQAHRVHRRLGLYKSILAGERVVARGQDLVQLELRLTGLVREVREPHEEPYLAVRNRIFASVYDQGWSPKINPAKLDPALWMKEHIERWIELGRKDAFVLRGEELFEARRWAEKQSELEPSCKEFLDASRVVDDRERALRVNIVLFMTLWAASSRFLLMPLLLEYWRQRHYPCQGLIPYLYAVPFVLCLPAGMIADKLQVRSPQMITRGLALELLGSSILMINFFVKTTATAFLAVAVMLAGQTIIRPHSAVLLGGLYPRNDRRVESAFIVFYLFVNISALLGPFLGTVMYRQYGWGVTIATLMCGTLIALYSFWLSQPAFGPLSLPLRDDLAVHPEMRRQRRLVIAWLALALLMFWTVFYALGEQFKNYQSTLPLFRKAYAGLRADDLFAQGLTSEAVTPLFVILVTPVFSGFLYLLHRRKHQFSPISKIGIGLCIGMILSGFIRLFGMKAQYLVLYYAVLTVAELLVVPISLSATSALSSSRALFSMMSGNYLIAGMGALLADYMANASRGVFGVFLALAALAAGVLLYHQRRWARHF